ncbi:MAG: Hpt domain-containing protein [Clostridium sp.]|uniref:Hpt domain-containing protein n=1 Tax=Clostridium sp. TaxID=1506 RepID=UPI002913E4A5|nr:Hpt domain-containing protein [Clostridium sp.]MDU5109457.1 Hpt domain-containing protein [Clostridium sp.]
MQERFLLELKKIGVDIDGTISRLCNNVNLYKKLLNKFLEDKNFEMLINSLKNSDYKNIEIYAHTLKGLSGNLGFVELSKACAEMVESIRKEELDSLSNIEEKIKSQYMELTTLIRMF